MNKFVAFVMVASLIGLIILYRQMEYSNQAAKVLASVEPYLPGHTLPTCSSSYLGPEFVSCILYNVPGFEMLSLTASEYSGTIINTYVVLEDTVTIGDLELLYGDPTLVKNQWWEWHWDDKVSAYRYSSYGWPGPLTEVSMISWH
jgi:hypothetical protein